jgi:hypothetical protein
MKDFRNDHQDSLADQEVVIKNIAENLANFIFNDNYIPAFGKWPEASKPRIGFIVAGYSFSESIPEEWRFEIVDGKLIGPDLLRPKDQVGITWNGQPEAITRLILGRSNLLASVLQECNVDNIKINEIMTKCNERLSVPFVIAPMPIKDAIDVAEFLVQTTIEFSKFSPGAPTVGGPIDIAAITKYEGFKWIKRKHYYNSEYNPKG